MEKSKMNMSFDYFIVTRLVFRGVVNKKDV